MLSIKQIANVKPSVFRFYREHVFGCCEIQKRLFSKIYEFSPTNDSQVLAMRQKLIYCDYLDYQKVRLNKRVQKIMARKKGLYDKLQKRDEHLCNPAYSVLLKDTINVRTKERDFQEGDIETTNAKPVHMPYARRDTFEIVKSMPENVQAIANKLKSNELNERYKNLYEKYLDLKKSTSGSNISFPDYVESKESSKVPDHWMTDYEQFDDTLLEDPWYGKEGTPNRNSEVSHIPCGGCGALLHCKDPHLPGYLPSELFPSSTDDLKRTHCKRCHFLKFYNTALEVKVSAEEYPNLLKVIKTKKCAVVLIVDLTDFPCSIWPDLKSVLHPLTPIFIVGNKIDLLPQDSPQFFTHVTNCLLKTVKDITKIENIMHVHLISAKTGYGVEELINKLHKKWAYKGDVYLIGCTNVGKSSLFNTLVCSDYCKSKAVNLVQRATVSPWPGTTLNLLKFPILNPTHRKLYQRQERLRAEQLYIHQHRKYLAEKFKTTGRIRYATLERSVGMTFTARKASSQNSFNDESHLTNTGPATLDETSDDFKHGRWCYDTPGTIHRDQVLDLLTTDELVLTLSHDIISPRSFVLKPGQTMFLAGLGRIDFLESHQNTRGNKEAQVGRVNKEKNKATLQEGNRENTDIQSDGQTIIETRVEEGRTDKNMEFQNTNEEIRGENDKNKEGANEEVETQNEVLYDEYIRCTLFASKDLPITICRVEDADEVYEKLLRTDAFVVPAKNPERLKFWPRMGSQEMKMTGISYKESVADVVLSSAGWVAITPQEGQSITLRAWTPEARGLYLRSPALLRKSIVLRGAKAIGTPLYKLGRQVYIKS